MTADLPAVAVVMPVCNEERGLEASIRAVLSQDYPGSLEVCIAVAPSTDGTGRVANGLAREDDRVSVVENPLGVTPTGLNIAVRATTAPIIVRVDGHAELEGGYITRAVETLRRTGAVSVGGIQDPRGTSPFEQAVGRAMGSRFGAGDARFHYGGQEGPVDTVYLGVFRREAIEAVGLYDESLVRNQDYELNWRLRDAGGTVWFDPALRVGYRPRGSLRALVWQFFQYGQWKRVVVRRHPRSLRWRQLAPPVTVLAIFVGLVGGWLWRPLLFLPVGYAVLVLAMSLVVGRTAGEFGRLLGVFPAVHVSWGCGFLIGGRGR